MESKREVRSDEGQTKSCQIEVLITVKTFGITLINSG